VPIETTSIPDLKVGDECWNFDLDGRLEAVVANIHLEAIAASYMQVEVTMAATSKVARLRETLPTASRVLDLYENPVT
jgi:hypothetical protein